jgi:peptidoglycan/LPS O-acetylase OafA/YrhL
MVEIRFHTATMIDVVGIDPSPAVPMLVFAIAVMVIGNAHRLQRPLTDTFGAERLKMIGRMTYPLYLLNQNIGAAIIVLLCRCGAPGWMAMAAAAGLVLATAYGVAIMVEPIVRRGLAALLGAPSGTTGRAHSMTSSA